MEIIVHIRNQVVLASRTSSQELGDLKIAQRNKFPLSVVFVDDGPSATQPIITVPIPEPYTRILVTARPNDNLTDEDLLFFSQDFTATGEGDTLHYVGDLNTLTAATAALFEGNATRGRHECLLDIDLLVTEDPDDGRLTLLKQRRFWLYRTLWNGTEGVPLEDVPSYPAPSSLMLRGTTAPDLRLDITALTGGGATALDGIPTAGIEPPYLAGIVSGGALRFYLLTTSTAAEAAPGIIRPDDYAPETNEKVWTQVL